MKKTALLISLLLNVILIAGIIWVRGSARATVHNALADATYAEVQLQEHILTELESADPERIAKVKAFLRRNISGGRETAARWRGAE
jgi:hypothetical protein